MAPVQPRTLSFSMAARPCHSGSAMRRRDRLAGFVEGFPGGGDVGEGADEDVGGGFALGGGEGGEGDDGRSWLCSTRAGSPTLAALGAVAKLLHREGGLRYGRPLHRFAGPPPRARERIADCCYSAFASSGVPSGARPSAARAFSR